MSLGFFFFFCWNVRWRWRHRDRHLKGDSITDGYTWSRQTFVFNKSGLFTDSPSHFSVVRQRWSCPAKWITTRVWVLLCSNWLLLLVHPSRPKDSKKPKATLLLEPQRHVWEEPGTQTRGEFGGIWIICDALLRARWKEKWWNCHILIECCEK